MDYERLKEMPIFYGISEEKLPPLLHCLGGYKNDYGKDELILLEGNDVKIIGIVLSGLVHMVKEDEEGNETILVTIGEDQLFGESFACGSQISSRVSFFAACPTTVLFLPFYKVIHSCRLSCNFHHRLIENMVRLISDKNVQLMEKIEVISKKSLREKIIAYLSGVSGGRRRKSFTVPLTRLELATYLCADRSALSRELSAMERDGLISFEKNTFTLL